MKARVDWDRIDLVVFDIDGTLYDAGSLRRAMAGQLLLEALRTRSLHTARVLQVFRQVREVLGDQEDAGFLRAQYEHTAQRVGTDAGWVQGLVQEWMERRPLPLLRARRWPHVEQVFAGLRAAGKRIAALSDYPAYDKLEALGLRVDLVATACDPGIARLKPNPCGLLALLQLSGVPPARTLMIGDRFDRDAAVARRAGTGALIRSARSHPHLPTFRRFDDAVFTPVLERAAGT